MLINNLYCIDEHNSTANTMGATITVNADNEIFKGHFPGQPVLPGVCMLQIIKELLQEALGKKLFMAEAAQCKFLSMVDPVKQPSLHVSINFQQNDEGVNTNSILKSGDQVVLKANILYTIND